MKVIPLTKGFETIVDDDEYELLSPFRWRVTFSYRKGKNTFYALRSSGRDQFGKYPKIIMHREIFFRRNPGANQEMVIDHIDGNGLNNIVSNLRIATRRQNRQNSTRPVSNTSGYLGVSWHKRNKKFRAAIWVEGKVLNLGLFNAPEEAAIERDKHTRAHFGIFGTYNFPLPGEKSAI